MRRDAIHAGCLLCAAALAAGCGSDYEPPRRATTGLPAGSLGPVLDVEIELPNLRIGTAPPGVTLDLRLELERDGDGAVPARVVPGTARWGMQSAPLVRLDDEPTVVDRDGATLSADGLGPFRVQLTAFDVFLDGSDDDGDGRFTGTATETQSGLPGTFDAWRRRRFLVAGTDFVSTTGRLDLVAWVRDERIETRLALESVSSDPAIARAGSAFLAVNRFSFDNVQRLDPASDFATVWQAGTGAGSNPQDAVAAPDGATLFVTRYDPPFGDLALLDAGDGALLDAIPLDAFAENPDGTPRPGDALAAHGLLWIALQDVDRTFSEYGEGKLAVVDPVARVALGAVPLGGKNPVSVQPAPDDPAGPRLYVSLGGIAPGLLPQELSGGVAVVDPATRAVERTALDDDDAGGNLGALAVAGPRLAYVVVSDA